MNGKCKQKWAQSSIVWYMAMQTQKFFPDWHVLDFQRLETQNKKGLWEGKIAF